MINMVLNRYSFTLNIQAFISYGVKSNDTSWYFKIPKDIDPNDELELLVYSGIRGQTAGIETELIGLKLERLKQ